MTAVSYLTRDRLSSLRPFFISTLPNRVEPLSLSSCHEVFQNWDALERAMLPWTRRIRSETNCKTSPPSVNFLPTSTPPPSSHALSTVVCYVESPNNQIELAVRVDSCQHTAQSSHAWPLHSDHPQLVFKKSNKVLIKTFS